MTTGLDRFTRQEDLVPRERLASVTATVIGVGAIGRQVALQLAAVGVPRLQLVDFDVVAPTNVTTQGYLHGDVGQPKVRAAQAAVWAIDPGISVETVLDRYRPQVKIGEAVFCCVDSIAARAAIWRSAASRCSGWMAEPALAGVAGGAFAAAAARLDVRSLTFAFIRPRSPVPAAPRLALSPA